MKRPNKLDWLIYRIFRWWWNPIFKEKAWLGVGLTHGLDNWYKEYLDRLEEI